MNWLRKCANHQDTGVFFTAVDPADFYEWKSTGTIPQGSRFSSLMPPSEVFSKGFVVATVFLPESSLEKTEDNMYRLKENTSAGVDFYVGSVLSPSEVIEKYHSMQRKFDKDTDHFRRTTLSQMFAVSPYDDKVYQVTEKNGKAHIEEYDTFPNIQKTLTLARRAIAQQSTKKQWRSFDLQPLRRFENTFVMMNNKNILVEPLDVAKMFNIANIKPLRAYDTSWPEYYVKMSEDAEKVQEKLSSLRSLSWIKAAETAK